MGYKEEPLHVQADADYFAYELIHSTVYEIDIERYIESIKELNFAKLVIESLLNEVNK